MIRRRSARTAAAPRRRSTPIRRFFRDWSKPDSERLAALKYLVHLVGDLHQPLHTSADTGGRAVVASGEKTTLHAVWDDAIIDSRKTDWRVLVDAVEAAPTGPVEPSTPVGWALEGRDIARDVIFADADLAASRHGGAPPTLPDSYPDDNWPIVRARLKQAGLRLLSFSMKRSATPTDAQGMSAQTVT